MESNPKRLPNVVLKKKLAPLPLFNQNQTPKHIFPSTSREQLLTEPKSLRGRNEAVSPNIKSSKALLSDLRNVNNYGRMCDQPFLEFSSFHYQQVFGSSGKKKVTLSPLSGRKEDKRKSPNTKSVHLIKGPVAREPLIKVEDQGGPLLVQGTGMRKEKEKEKEKDERTVISHRYRINDHEATISFVSLELVLTSEGKQNNPISIRVGKDDIEKIYKYPQKMIEESVLKSLSVSGSDIKLNIKKITDFKLDGLTLDKIYPEKSGNLDVTHNNKIYAATINYPHLELSIPDLNYREKVALKPSDLERLFEEKFNNLLNYASMFTLPSPTLPPAPLNENEEANNYEDLENLPTVIKKVVKEKDFGGLVLFKSAEIHLKSVSDSTEVEPQTVAEEQNMATNQRRGSLRKRTGSKPTVLRIKVRDLVHFTKLSDGEVVELIKKSIVSEGQNLSIKIEQGNTSTDNNLVDALPETSDKFTVQFGQSTYEGFINRFPTLELYVPESNFRDVVQLTRSQLQELLNNRFRNLEDYMHLFKKPIIEQVPEISASQTQPADSNENNYEELENLPTVIKKVVKEKDFGGLVLFKSAEIYLKNISNTEPQAEPEEQQRRGSILRKKNGSKPAVLRIKVRDLVNFVKRSDEEIIDLIKKSIILGEGQILAVSIEKGNTSTDKNLADTLPETSDKFTVQFDQSTYEGFIKFPTLELYVPESNFRDVVQLTRSQLQELLNTAFRNLEHYMHLFKKPTFEQPLEQPEPPQTQPTDLNENNENNYEELENLPTVIKKVVKEKDFGGLVLFRSAEIHLKNTNEAMNVEPQVAPEEQQRRGSLRKKNISKPAVLRIKVRDLIHFTKLSDGEIVDLLKKSIVSEGQSLSVRIEKGNTTAHKNPVDALPETSEKFTVDQSSFEGFIKFPTLELYVPESNFRDVVQLTRSQLQELFNTAFKNLEDYMHLFKKPPIEEAPLVQEPEAPQVQATDLNDELESLPTIIKKVVKETNFGGLVLFKSAEIHLKNTSGVTDTEPQKTVEEQNSASARRMSIRKKNGSKPTLLRIKVKDLIQFVKLTDEEIVELIKKSIVSEGQNLAVKIEKDSTSTSNETNLVDTLPETSEKFTVQFDQSTFEGFIKLPTLELYVPESNFKDVVQLTRSQLQELLNNAFKNLEDYMHLFKKPTFEQDPEVSSPPAKTDNNMNDYPNDDKPLNYNQLTISAKKA